MIILLFLTLKITPFPEAQYKINAVWCKNSVFFHPMPKDPCEMTLFEIERRRFCHKANEAASKQQIQFQ